MNTFTKLTDGSWGVAMTSRGETGQTISVSLRSGATKQVTLGAFIETKTYAGVASYRFAVAPQARAERPTAQVGAMSGILALFAKATRNLKRPAIVLGVPAIGDLFSIRLSIAGPQAKVPGSITVCDGTKDPDGQRPWYGRVTLDGVFQPSRDCPSMNAMAARLSAFSADPVGVAGEHGRLTGRCCFCNRGLEDERSTAVGYGPVCAENYDLPWGEVRHSFRAEAVQVEARV